MSSAMNFGHDPEPEYDAPEREPDDHEDEPIGTVSNTRAGSSPFPERRTPMHDEGLVFIDGDYWHAEACEYGYLCDGRALPDHCPEWATFYLRSAEGDARRFLCDHHFEAARAIGEKH